MIPDILLVVAAALACMGAVVLGSTLARTDDELAAVGYMFAGSLAVAAVFVGLMAVALLGPARGRGEAYYAPVAVGLFAGAAEVVLLYDLQTIWMWAPPLLTVLALRPVRRRVFRSFYGGRR